MAKKAKEPLEDVLETAAAIRNEVHVTENPVEEVEPQPLVEFKDPLERVAALMERIAAAQAGNSPELLDRLTVALEKVAEGQRAGSMVAADALRRAHRPEGNQTPPRISSLNPRGDKDYPRPELKCKFFLPWEADWRSLSREEIELLNLVEPGEYFITRNDRTKVRLRIEAKLNQSTGKPEAMLMTHETAFKNDHHFLMPPLITMLREVCRQVSPEVRKAANDILTMDEEADAIAAGQLPVSVGE